VPSKRVWRRDDGAEADSVEVSSGDVRAPTALVGHGQGSCSNGSGLPVPASGSQPAMPAFGKQTDARSQRLRASSAVTVKQRPRSLAWRNPALVTAEQKPAGPALTAAAAMQTAASARTSSRPAQRITAEVGVGARRRPLRSTAFGGHLPGGRAAALGRAAEGRVGKKLRSNKLQRIGEHLYRAQTGTVGRTLQRQGATPTANVRLVRPVS